MACRYIGSEGETRDNDDRCIDPSKGVAGRDSSSIERHASSVRSHRGRTCKSIRSSGSLDSGSKGGREHRGRPPVHERHNVLPRRKRFQTEEMRRDA